MKKNRPIIILLVMLILTVLVVFLSCRYVTQVKNGQILKTVYLFNLATDKEKELTQSEFVSLTLKILIVPLPLTVFFKKN